MKERRGPAQGGLEASDERSEDEGTERRREEEEGLHGEIR